MISKKSLRNGQNKLDDFSFFFQPIFSTFFSPVPENEREYNKTLIILKIYIEWNTSSSKKGPRRMCH